MQAAAVIDQQISIKCKRMVIVGVQPFFKAQITLVFIVGVLFKHHNRMVGEMIKDRPTHACFPLPDPPVTPIIMGLPFVIQLTSFILKIHTGSIIAKIRQITTVSVESVLQ